VPPKSKTWAGGMAQAAEHQSTILASARPCVHPQHKKINKQINKAGEEWRKIKRADLLISKSEEKNPVRRSTAQYLSGIYMQKSSTKY
jgi:hypothetical protein